MSLVIIMIMIIIIIIIIKFSHLGEGEETTKMLLGSRNNTIRFKILITRNEPKYPLLRPRLPSVKPETRRH